MSGEDTWAEGDRDPFLLFKIGMGIWGFNFLSVLFNQVLFKKTFPGSRCINLFRHDSSNIRITCVNGGQCAYSIVFSTLK